MEVACKVLEDLAREYKQQQADEEEVKITNTPLAAQLWWLFHTSEVAPRIISNNKYIHKTSDWVRVG